MADILQTSFLTAFFNENLCILIKISWQFVPGVQLTICQHWSTK